MEYKFYMAIASFGSILFGFRLISIFVGDVMGAAHGLGEVHVHDVGHPHATANHSDNQFKLLSIISIFGFLMGFGWSGLSFRFEHGFSSAATAALAFAAGFATMVLTSTVMYLIKRLDKTPDYELDMASMVGKNGMVYLPKEDGKATVQIQSLGGLKEFEAIVKSGEVKAFQRIRVAGIYDGKLLVEPIVGLQSKES
jgi:hypothetical protein